MANPTISAHKPHGLSISYKGAAVHLTITQIPQGQTLSWYCCFHALEQNLNACVAAPLAETELFAQRISSFTSAYVRTHDQNQLTSAIQGQLSAGLHRTAGSA